MADSPVTKEIERSSGSGYLWVAIGIALVLAGTFFVVRPFGLSAIAIGVVLILAGAFVLAGLYMLQPNEAAILLLFGEYVGRVWFSSAKLTGSEVTRPPVIENG